MRARSFRQVDVFSDEPYRGNPVAVVLDGDGLSDAEMQRFARWTQLSETTFVTPPADPAADYAVRIFTPGGELPFAGHPTLGTCHAWLAAEGRPRGADEIVQQCGVGLVRIRAEGARLAFAAPPLRRFEVDPALLAEVGAALGIGAAQVEAAQWLDNGPHWLALRLGSAGSVLALEPDHAALARSQAKVGVIGPHPQGAECAFEVRAFAASIGIAEDPVTGSLNASLAQWLIDEGVAPPRYVAAQGTRLDRTGRVHVAHGGGETWIGGASVTCIEGSVLL
jgi:PhzF family phenazine biosynthesis protein